jgi:hypothetical protein
MKESIPECERLPRGPVSRLGGDRFLAGAVPSQIVFVIVTVLSPSAGTAG